MKRAINFTLIRDNSAGKKILNRNQFHRMKLAFRSDFRLEMIGEQKYEIEIMNSKKNRMNFIQTKSTRLTCDEKGRWETIQNYF